MRKASLAPRFPPFVLYHVILSRVVLKYVNLPCRGKITYMLIPRFQKEKLVELLENHSAVGLLGPRQVGKTTLAHEIAEGHRSVYLDLELPSDRNKLAEPELFFQNHLDDLVILDEIQRTPEIFQILRSFIDRRRKSGQIAGMYLVLGSASLDLLKQSAESLAGRIAYLELAPLCVRETDGSLRSQRDLWIRGGFPSSFLAKTDKQSLEWRQSFIQTYLQRDVAQLGPRIPYETLHRLWKMLAHNQGGLFNASPLSSSLGVSGQTVGRYVDLLADLFLVRKLQPWTTSIRSRLIKSPKVFVRDSGLLHALLNIHDYDDLLGHPVIGSSFEGFVIENLIAVCAPFRAEFGFYRTSGGAEIDLVISFPNNQLFAIEVKHTLTPKLERGFFSGCDDLQPSRKFVVYPGGERFPLANDVDAISLSDLVMLIASGEHLGKT